jgi:hypothetical protein
MVSLLPPRRATRSSCALLSGSLSLFWVSSGCLAVWFFWHCALSLAPSLTPSFSRALPEPPSLSRLPLSRSLPPSRSLSRAPSLTLPLSCSLSRAPSLVLPSELKRDTLPLLCSLLPPPWLPPRLPPSVPLPCPLRPQLPPSLCPACVLPVLSLAHSPGPPSLPGSLPPWLPLSWLAPSCARTLLLVRTLTCTLLAPSLPVPSLVPSLPPSGTLPP